VAIGTTVVRALEHSAARFGAVVAATALADQRIGAQTRLRVVDAILSGTHEPGTSHYDLLRAFADDSTLRRADQALDEGGFRTHEFGDSVLIFAGECKDWSGRVAVRILRAFCAPPMWFKNLVVYRLPADWSVATS
jgi:S-adenosylmethionine:tRNA-ribosyltransferase-isomerase (queuine synthetase)